MNPRGPDPHIANALAVARLRAWRVALVELHKQVIDEERRRYERAHGPIDGPHHALHLLMRDPWFAWLRPMAEVIVHLDERLSDDRPVARPELDAAAADIRHLLQGEAFPHFAAPYRRALQEVPDIVVAHGRVLGLLETFGLPSVVKPAGADHHPGDGQR